MTSRLLLLMMISSGPLLAQKIPLATIQLRADPESALVRPYQSVVVQLLAYGEVTTPEGQGKKVRLALSGSRFSLKNSGAGWLSKPFRHQGEETEPFYQDPDDSWGGRLLGQALGNFVMIDSVLYTAPETPGRYQIEGRLQGKKAALTITVDPQAPSQHAPPRNLPVREPDDTPHRDLVEYHSPLIAQETWFEPHSDYITRFDFDGDWVGDNNWDATLAGGSQAYVYYAVMETQTHWFLIYDIFHSRDYSDTCVAGTCHENDSEGLILTVAKDGSRFGRVLSMETLAHNNIYSYRADRRVKRNAHDIDGKVEFYQSHPVVFVESGGHGVYGSDDKHSRYNVKRDRFETGTGVTYIYKGQAERPLHPHQRLTGYELLPAYQHLWLRGHRDRSRHERLFDEYFTYQPFGNRPRTPYHQIAGAFLGRKKASNKARPFWSWSDNRTRDKKILSQGQWGLDPAYAVQQNLKMPQPFSLEYVFNLYLGVEPSAQPTVSPLGPATKAPSAGGQRRTTTISHPARSFLPARRANSFDADSNRGSFDLKIRVDSRIDVFVRAETIAFEMLDGQPPSDRGSEYSQGIPRASFRSFQVKKVDGRGEVRLLEKPGPENNFTLKLRFDDPKRGADNYHARVTWEWDRMIQPVPIPASVVESSPTSALDVEEVELFSTQNRPSDYDDDRDGEFEFRGRIDDRVVITLRTDRVFARVLRGRSPELDEFSFSQPLPRQALSKLEVQLQDGRGELRLLERPWEGNEFSAVIEILDTKGGDDHYRFKVKWRR